MTVYAAPGQPDSLVSVASRYGHYIGGQWVDPIKGGYFENISPVNGKPFTEIARGTEEDIEAALDAAHAAAPAWGKTSTTERSNILLKIADVMEANLASIAVAAPVTTSPPAKTPSTLVSKVFASTWMVCQRVRLSVSPKGRKFETLPPSSDCTCVFWPMAAMMKSQSMVNSDPRIGFGLRRPLESGSPSSISTHSRPQTQPSLSPITFTGAAVAQTQAVYRRVADLVSRHPDAAAYSPGTIL